MRLTKNGITTESTLDKIKKLVKTFKIEDPNKFSYKGCGIIHGYDGKINNWSKYEDSHLEKIYSLLVMAKSKNTVIKLDYSKNPNNISDEISIVTCSCKNYEELKKIINDKKLNFSDINWHTEDINNDPMASCLNI